MPRHSVRRTLGIVATTAILASTSCLALPASASQPMKAKKYQSCWYFTDDKDNTITCGAGVKGNPVKVVVDGQCWQYVVEGAYAQELIHGTWTDRRDIPVTWTDEPFCPTATPHASVLTVRIPAAPFVLHTYRVAIPETAGFQAAFGDPMTACVRWTKSPKFCGD